MGPDWTSFYNTIELVAWLLGASLLLLAGVWTRVWCLRGEKGGLRDD